MTKSTKILLGLLIIVLVGGFGFLFSKSDLLQGNMLKSQYKDLKADRSIQKPCPACPSQILSFLGYHFGFSIKYPSGYFAIEDNSWEDASGEYQAFYSFKKNEKDRFIIRTLKETQNQYYLDQEPVGNIMLGGQTAYQYSFPAGYCDGPGCSEPMLAFKTYKNERAYLIVFNNVSVITPEIQQILNGFAFYSDLN